MNRSRQSGFTLIEIVVAVTLVAIVVGNIYSVLGRTSQIAGRKTNAYEADVQAQRTLALIKNALVGSEEGSLVLPSETPGSTHSLEFIQNLGLQDGAMVTTAPQRIALLDDVGPNGGRAVAWFQDAGLPSERRMVWTKSVTDLLEGENTNGSDDNKNGLIDEAGLSFVKQGRLLRIYLTVRRPGPDGTMATRTLSTEVTCRN